MVYDPGAMRRLGLGEALWQALFPRSVMVLSYAFYQPGERGTLGNLVNSTLHILVGVNRALNLVLLPLLLLTNLIAGIVSLPLALPYWVYRRLFGGDHDPLHTPRIVRVLVFPGQTLIWLVSTPVKVVQVMTVLVAFFVGPRE